MKLNQFCELYQPSWSNAANVQAYKAAVGLGMSDFLEDYVECVTALEEMVLLEGPVPLNEVHQRLHKYMLVMPVLQSIVCTLDKRFVALDSRPLDPLPPPDESRSGGVPPHGALILEYLMSFQTGMPVIKSVIDRLIVHVQQVFVKQCFGWILFGELLDSGSSDQKQPQLGQSIPSKEFFIQHNPENAAAIPSATTRGADTGAGTGDDIDIDIDAYSSLLHQVSSQMTAAQADTKALFESHSMSGGIGNGSGGNNASSAKTNLPFEWNSSYTLKYEMVPQSMVSLSVASLILFSGKAVKLMSHMNTQRTNSNKHSSDQGIGADVGLGASKRDEVYQYFVSHGAVTSASLTGDRTELSKSTSTDSGSGAGSCSAPSSSSSSLIDVECLLSKHCALCGYSEEAWGRFARRYQELLELLNGQCRVESRGRSTSTSNSNGTSNGTSNSRNQSRSRSRSRSPSQRVNTAVTGSVAVDSATTASYSHMVRDLFANFVVDVHRVISSQVWKLLRDTYRFPLYLCSLRNTFLLGKGEFYQLLFDSILETVDSSGDPLAIGNRISSPHSRGKQPVRTAFGSLSSEDESSLADIILNHKIVRAAAKLLSYDDSCFNSIYSLRVNRPNVLIRQFESLNSGENSLEYALVGSGFVSQGRVELVSTAVVDSELIRIDEIWRHCLGEHSCDVADRGAKATLIQSNNGVIADGASNAKTRESGAGSNPGEHFYSRGGFYLTDEKFVSKGFSCSLVISFAWMYTGISPGSGPTQGALLTPAHSVLEGLKPLGSVDKDMPWMSSRNSDNKNAVLVGSSSVILHANKSGNKTNPNEAGAAVGVTGKETLLQCMGVNITNSVSVNICVFAYLLDSFVTDGKSSSGGVSVGYYAQLSVISLRDDNSGRFWSTGSVVGSGRGTGDDMSVLSRGAPAALLGQTYISIDTSSASSAHGLRADQCWLLELEYSRRLSNSASVNDTASVSPSVNRSGAVSVNRSTAGGAGAVKYTLTANLSNFTVGADYPSVSPTNGALTVDVELHNHVPLRSGYCWLGVTGSSLVFAPAASASASSSTSSKSNPSPADGPQLMHVSCLQFQFASKGIIGSSYPISSSFTSSKYPETYHRLSTLIHNFHGYMQLKLDFAFPTLFKIIIDESSLSSYQRLFTQLMKVRLVVHALERLWKLHDGSGLSFNRSFCWIRYSMHFFVSNLFFFYQVDIIDSEYNSLMNALKDPDIEFSTVVRTCRNFLSGVVKSSMIDNSVVCDAIDSILHLCIRFLSICKLLLTEEVIDTSVTAQQSGSPHITVIPPEEFDSLHSEFTTQVAYLIHMIKKVESGHQGFLFRLDFNGFMANLQLHAAQSTALKRSTGTSTGAGNVSVNSTVNGSFVNNNRK